VLKRGHAKIPEKYPAEEGEEKESREKKKFKRHHWSSVKRGNAIKTQAFEASPLERTDQVKNAAQGIPLETETKRMIQISID